MRAGLAALALLALAGCDKPRPEAAPAAPVKPAAIARTDWSMSVTAGGLAMVHTSSGLEDLRLSCAGDGRMGARARSLERAGPAVSLSIEISGRTFALAGEPQSVGEGSVGEDLLTALSHDEPILLEGGGGTLGPIAAPPADLRLAPRPDGQHARPHAQLHQEGLVGSLSGSPRPPGVKASATAAAASTRATKRSCSSSRRSRAAPRRRW